MDPLVLFYPFGHEAHEMYGHVERPDRLTSIRQALEAGGWWERFPSIPPQALSEDFLLSTHSADYLQHLQHAVATGRPLDPDTYTTPASYRIALESAGGAVAVARAVWKGEARRGFALCRPPGHHATRNRGMGFCLLNNVALAAADLQTNAGAGRLAIIDLDLHHGNGTQDIFYDREDVFYFSIHQFPFYPGTGRLEEVGVGPGKGFTANFPIPAGSGDSAVLTVIGRLILPLLDRFQPEILLVSAGFDTHWRDPLGGLQMSAAGYGDTVGRLVGWADENANGRIALFLEGGYDLMGVAACAEACTASLLAEDWTDPIGLSPYPEQQGWREMVERGERLWRIS